ncbi:pepdidoglycan bound protein, partial [Listeria marthii FSL S4-120]
MKKIETKNAVKSATTKPTDVTKVTKDDKTDLPSTGDKGT